MAHLGFELSTAGLQPDGGRITDFFKWMHEQWQRVTAERKHK